MYGFGKILHIQCPMETFHDVSSWQYQIKIISYRLVYLWLVIQLVLILLLHLTELVLLM